MRFRVGVYRASYSLMGLNEVEWGLMGFTV